MPLGNPIRKQNESRMVSVLATEGQTVFTVQGGYIINHLSVFRNGVRLSPAEDFTAGDGSTVTLNNAANIDDRIDFHIFDRFTVQNAIVGAASTQTINGDLVLNGKLFGQLDVPSINLTGIITATELDLNGKADISSDLTVTRHLNVSGISTFQNNVHLLDSDRLQIGGSAGTVDGIELYHDGSHSYIADSGTGELRLRTNVFNVQNAAGDETLIGATENDSVALYFNNNQKLVTTNTGLIATGIVTATDFSGAAGAAADFPNGLTGTTGTFSGIVQSSQFKLLDNAKAIYGTGGDMEIYHNATNSLIQNGTGTLQIITTTGDLFLRGQDNITFNTAGNNERVRITSAGNLGINESSPSHKLVVGGDIGVGFNTPNDAARQINFNVNRGSAGDTLANINWQWNNKYVAQIRGIAGADTSNKDDAHLAFFTSAANNLVERLRIDSSGRILQGSSTGRNTALMAAQATYQLEGVGSNASNIGIFCNSNGTAAGGIEFGKTRGTSTGGTTIVASGDDLGHISFEGSDGSAQRVAARINVQVDGTPGSSDMPGRIRFLTTPDGSASEVERMRIDSAGRVSIGNNNAQTVYPFYVATDLNSGGNLLSFGNTDSTYSQGLTLSFDSNKDMKWAGGSGTGGLIWDVGTRGYSFKIGTSEKLTIASDGRLTSTRSTTTAYSTTATTNDSSVIILNSGAAGHATLQFQSLSGGSANTGQATISAFNESSGSKNTALTLGTRQNSDSTVRERMRIDSSGNIGMGTLNTTIDEALQVERAGNVTIMAECNATGSGANAAVRLKSADSGSDWYMQTGNVTGGSLRFYAGGEKMRINPGSLWVIGGTSGMPTSSSGARLQVGAHTFDGSHYAHATSRLGIQNNGSLTCISNCSTYNDGTYPGYGFVMVQGASTSSYNTMGICPDGPARGTNMNFHIKAQETNIHSGANARQVWFNASGNAYKRDNSANWSTTSDERLKKNIVDNNKGLASINQLRVTSFEYRKEDEIDMSLFPEADNPRQVIIEGEEGVHTGVIAQEIEKVLPECVETNERGAKTVNPDNLTWYLVNAVKELSTKNDALEARLAALEGS